MTRPLDRNAHLPALGEMDEEAGEFWVTNPFEMPTNGMNLSAYERNRLFLNRDGDRFLDASFASGADIDSDSRGVVAADFDRDGATDLLVLSVGGGPLRLFRNRYPVQGNRVRVELVGSDGNRAAIGARVVAEAGGRRVVRDLFPHNGGVGQAPAELLLGLGRAKRIDRLTIRWPRGQTVVYTDLPVEVTLRIVEGEDKVIVASIDPRGERKKESSR